MLQNPYNAFLRADKIGEDPRKIVEKISSKYLANNQYWYYAFHSIVIDRGGLFASAIKEAMLFVSADWILIVEFARSDEDASPSFNDIIKFDEGYQDLYISGFRIDKTTVKEVTNSSILMKVQKRSYEIMLTEGSSTITFISLQSPEHPVQDEKATKEVYQDLCKVKEGEVLVKPWHKVNS